MAQNRIGVAIEVGEVTAGILVQRKQGVVMMVMGHLVAERREEAFRGIGLRVISRGVDQPEMVPVHIDGFAQLLGATQGVDAEIIRKHQGDPAAFFRTAHEVIDLATVHLGGPSHGDAVGEPAVTPIGGDEPDDLGALPRSPNQTLTVVAFGRPATGDRGMQTDIDLVLDVEVGPGQEAQQFGKIGGNLIPQIVINEGVPIERSGR